MDQFDMDMGIDESMQPRSSSNALFGAQFYSLNLDLAKATDSPEPFLFSSCLADGPLQPTETSVSAVTDSDCHELYTQQECDLSSISGITDSDSSCWLWPNPRAWTDFFPCALGWAYQTASDDGTPTTLITTHDTIEAGPDRNENCYPSLRPLQHHDLDYHLNSDVGYGPRSISSVYSLSEADDSAVPAWSDSGENPHLSLRHFRCNWPKCSSAGLFTTIEEHKIHIKAHARDVRHSWRPGGKCTWYNCSSKASHKTPALFDTHLNNIHVNPLVCTVKDCKHKTPFRANHDLHRHIATAHADKSMYKCPYYTCTAGTSGFSRKDKWLSHLKQHHDTEPCPFAHCQNQTENFSGCGQSAAQHIRKAHSNFECALKSCEGNVSRFSESQLLEHLELHHALEWAVVLMARDRVKAARDHTLRSGHIMQNVEVRDCKICRLGRGPRAASHIR